jgi:hypothetical protein
MDRVGEIYTQRMRWVGAAGHYFFVPAYFFEDLAWPLGPALRLFVVLAEGSVASADLFVVCGGIVQYQLGGSDDNYLALAPMKLLFDAFRLWGTERGHKVHLGGGVGAQAGSLFHLKAGLSDRRQASSEHKARWNARKELRSASAGHFPAYRAPVVPLAHAVA